VSNCKASIWDDTIDITVNVKLFAFKPW